MVAYLKNSMLYTVYLFGASALAILTSMIPSYIANALTHDEYIKTLAMVISMIISMMITMYILLYRTGYQRNNSPERYKKSELFISLAFTILIHFIIGLILRYFTFLYSPVLWLSRFIIGDSSDEALVILYVDFKYNILNLIF